MTPLFAGTEPRRVRGSSSEPLAALGSGAGQRTSRSDAIVHHLAPQWRVGSPFITGFFRETVGIGCPPSSAVWPAARQDVAAGA